ncbi:hypothetical protein RCG23_02115 [Neobacillus sp. PS3-34]|uniref:hypothetical protein n=1 Tax=Neobacillus sp. PS3-34 TaxID=3070678 RepID=UPI0027DF9DC1|nr:hypothetical protein [Neobacillus sp. PS3-34]WML48935.1 hypothetical protein RCG23_02115 [Neobacillus sp. PS3-34]
MSKKILIALLSLGLIVLLYFLASRPGSSPGSNSIPTTSLEEKICTKVAAQYGDCKKVILIDTNSNVAFAETGFGILPVLISKDHTEMVKMIPGLDFQEFREEKEETGPITWRVENNVQKDFSIIYGFARDNAKTIIINSEGNIQPNKFFVRDDLAGMSGGSGTAALWVWYVTSKDEMFKPADVTVYGADGHIIYGGSKEE